MESFIYLFNQGENERRRGERKTEETRTRERERWIDYKREKESYRVRDRGKER